MVMAQDPELLLVDEPVAGMTDEETERTGRAAAVDRRASARCSSSSTTWSSSGRSRARSPCCTRAAVLCEGPVEQVQRTIRGCWRSISAGARGRPMLSVERLDVAYGEIAGPLGRRPRGAGRAAWSASWAATASARRPLLQAPSWASCRPAPGASCCDGPDITRLVARPSGRAPGIGYVPQGREIFPHLTRGGEPPDGRCSAASRADVHRRRASTSSPRSSSCSPARAACCRAASSSSSPSAARCSRGPSSSSSTSRPRESSPRSSCEIEDAIQRIKTERGIAVLLVEQYLEFAERLADSYAIMPRAASWPPAPPRISRREMVKHHLAV